MSWVAAKNVNMKNIEVNMKILELVSEEPSRRACV
jgi:hypothetical protein